MSSPTSTSGPSSDTLGVILRRRSIRKFRPEQIPDSDLERIVEAGLWAPSAMNQQQWHFTVVQSKDLLARLAVAIQEGLLVSGIEHLAERARTPGYSPLHGAPTVIVISAGAHAPWIQIDCGAAAENIALAAEALGLGSCLMAMPGLLFASDESGQWARELGFPDGYSHMISVALGYREGDDPAPRPRRPDVVRYVR